MLTFDPYTTPLIPYDTPGEYFGTVQATRDITHPIPSIVQTIMVPLPDVVGTASSELMLPTS
jgi:hypothetical protein